jgi:hypothetical protein
MVIRTVIVWFQSMISSQPSQGLRFHARGRRLWLCVRLCVNFPAFLPMEHDELRLLIRTKLEDGRLPSDRGPSAFGLPGNGDKCDACAEQLTAVLMMMEFFSSRRNEWFASTVLLTLGS